MATAKKTTVGFVTQTFDLDTGKCISQEFICGDDCEWQDEDDEIIDEPDNAEYFSYEMVQP